jgi:hypothetical protein
MRFTGRHLTRLTAAVAVAAATFLPDSASAAAVTVHFQGVVSSAQNLVFDDPSIPTTDFFQVGQAFSGDLSWDDAIPGDTSDPENPTFTLLGFDITIGGKDFSDRFLPRLIGTSSDGTVTFLTGGADQGGSARLVFDLGTFTGLYPTVASLKGKPATFSYADYQPLGGLVSGRAFISAVPEPTTWAMMIVGFGVIGGGLRRRSAVRTLRTA